MKKILALLCPALLMTAFFMSNGFGADKGMERVPAQAETQAAPATPHGGSHDSYDPTKGREIYDFDGGKMGEITFSHWKHQKLVNGDCKACHHKGGGKIARLIHKPESCFKCHGKETKVKAKEAFHYTCRKCHENRNPELSKCNVCHNRPVMTN